NQQHVNHAAAVSLVERQPTWKDGRILPPLTDLQVIGRFGPRVARRVRRPLAAAQQRGALLAPGEPRSEISVPWVTMGRAQRGDFHAQIQDRASEPGPEALLERGQHLILRVDQDSLRDDLAKRRPAGVRADVLGSHRAAGIEDDLLAKAWDARPR